MQANLNVEDNYLTNNQIISNNFIYFASDASLEGDF